MSWVRQILCTILAWHIYKPGSWELQCLRCGKKPMEVNVGYWKDVSIKRSTPRTFKCVRCEVEEEALPWGMEDLQGGTHYVYSLPEGWWGISKREGTLLFCRDEAVTIVGGEVLGD